MTYNSTAWKNEPAYRRTAKNVYEIDNSRLLTLAIICKERFMKGKVPVRWTSMFNKIYPEMIMIKNSISQDKELLCTKRFLLMGVPCFL